LRGLPGLYWGGSLNASGPHLKNGGGSSPSRFDRSTPLDGRDGRREGLTEKRGRVGREGGMDRRDGQEGVIRINLREEKGERI